MEKQSPLISVIMPLYNAERFVGESIGNILGQTVGDFAMHRPQDKDAGEVSAVTFFAAPKLSNSFLTRMFISASDTSGR